MVTKNAEDTVDGEFMTITILHVITTIERGGAENQLTILCKQQISLGYKVSIAYLKGEPELLDDLRAQGVQVKRLNGAKLITHVYGLRKLLSSQVFDLIHAHLPRSELVASLCFTKVPIVISRHNSEHFFPKAPKWFSRLLSLFCINRSSARIAISKSVLDFMTVSEERKNKHDFDIVYYGFDFDPPSGHKRREHKEFEEWKFLSMGRLVVQKDFATLLYGLNYFKNFNQRFHATILGTGKLENDLKALMHDLHLNQEVTFGGRTDNTSYFYLNSDIFVLTSLYEGFGLVLIEAMNFNIPIICAKFDAALEVLGENYSGFFQIGDAKELSSQLLWALNNRELLINQMSKRRQKFESEGMALKIHAIYEKTISISRIR
jgi:glycosyltransferase involved in cell wall biosynthesis